MLNVVMLLKNVVRLALNFINFDILLTVHLNIFILILTDLIH